LSLCALEKQINSSLTLLWLQEVPKEQDSELKVIVRRNQMMQKLLAVLDSAAALGKGPAILNWLAEVILKKSVK